MDACTEAYLFKSVKTYCLFIQVVIHLPGESQWWEEKHHEEQKKVEFTHHAQLLTRPERQT